MASSVNACKWSGSRHAKRRAGNHFRYSWHVLSVYWLKVVAAPLDQLVGQRANHVVGIRFTGLFLAQLDEFFSRALGKGLGQDGASRGTADGFVQQTAQGAVGR
nr:hypothetical protein pPsy0462a_00057 [Pseudomonas syringae]